MFTFADFLNLLQECASELENDVDETPESEDNTLIFADISIGFNEIWEGR